MTTRLVRGKEGGDGERGSKVGERGASNLRVASSRVTSSSRKSLFLLASFEDDSELKIKLILINY